jgi:hypothetical protein
MLKIAQAILGIPDKTIFKRMPSTKETEWSLNVQQHDAKRAGKHFDLRLNDPNTNHAYSWALRSLPASGQKVLAIEQPTHSKDYMGWSGVIESGYGAGKVRSKIFDKIEVLDSTPDRITFNAYGPGQKVTRYLLTRTSGKQWLLFNYTKVKDPNIPDYKPKMKHMEIGKIDLTDTSQVIAPKADGAHTTISIRPNKRLDVYSYRLSKKRPERIDHTYRTDLYKLRGPKELGNTVIRSELYLPRQSAAITAGLLNTDVWKSREKQLTMTGKLKNMIFDVVRFKGKHVEDKPYAEKLLMLKEINRAIPQLKLPELAHTPVQKERLLREIKNKHHPETTEGVVLYNLDKSVPVKAKMHEDYDVRIIGTFKADPASKYHGKGIGGFVVRPEYDQSVTFKVGSGLSDVERKLAYSSPEDYIGQWAKIKGYEKHVSGKIGKPVYLGRRFEKYRSGK